MAIPFQRKLAQVAFVVKDIEQARKRFAHMLGVEPPEVIVTEPGNERNLTYLGRPGDAQAKLAFFELGGVQLELIEPIGDESAWAEGLAEKGERVHHIGFWTEDMKEAADYLGAHGAPLVMRGDMGESGQYAYFDGRERYGCYIELLEKNATLL